MSRTSRIPYHQNVYDLLQLEPGESREAARMIAAHEISHGLLPAAMREWYLIPNMVPLIEKAGVPRWALARGTIWYRFSNPEQIPALSRVLSRFAVPVDPVETRFVQVLCENQGVVRWWVERNSGDNPPVWVDNGEPDEPTQWAIEADQFSECVFGWFAYFGFTSDFQLIREPDVPGILGVPRESVAAYTNGLWLRTPAEPFEPAVIDFLTDQFDEPERTPRPGNVTTYTFRPQGGIIRVTADEPMLGGGLSAWWVHADTSERLAELGRLIVPFGTLRDTFRADTEPAREVLASLQK